MRPIHALCALSLTLVACGGGGSGQDGLVQELAPLQSITVEDATRVRNLAVLRVGKEGGATLRAVLRFEIPTPPVGMRLERATLEIGQRQATPNTYSVLGPVIVQSIAPGPTIDPGDAAIDGETEGTLATDDVVELKTLDVTTHVLSLLGSGASFVDLRVQFQGDAGSFATPLFTEFDQDNSSGGGTVLIRWHWQLAY